MTEQGMAAPRRELGPGALPSLILAGLVLLALALRFYKLGAWNFEATEMFTLRDSVRPQFHNPRPLGYLLTYFLVRPFRPLDEFGLRLLPAVFGVLAIPAVYWTTRRLVGTRAALFAAFLLTVSGWHVYFSQFARYWSLVFLFSAIYPFALYVGVRERNGRALALGFLCLVLGVLAHPVAALLVGGPAIYLIAKYARPRYLRQAWTYPAFRWGAAVALLLLVALSFRLLPILHGWISMHDRNPGMGQFLLRRPVAQGLKQVLLLTAYFEGLTFPLVLAAAAGIYLLWRERDRALGIFLACLAVFPLAFIALISIRTPVSTFYILPTAPVFFLGAGIFLDRLFAIDWTTRPRWLMPVTITVMMVLAGMPTLFSQYRNGRRFDFRGVAHFIQPHLRQNDLIYSDQPMVLSHYLDSLKVEKLRHNPEPLQEALTVARPSGATLWVVAPAPAHALRTNLKQGGLAHWLYTNCQLRNIIGRGRLDFRQQYLQVFGCPPVPAPAAAAQVGASTSPLRASTSR